MFLMDGKGYVRVVHVRSCLTFSPEKKPGQLWLPWFAQPPGGNLQTA